MEVHIKIRPPLASEVAQGHLSDSLQLDTDTGTLLLTSSYQPVVNGRNSPVSPGAMATDNTKSFHFDNVHEDYVRQEDFYEEIGGTMVERTLKNHDTTVIVMGPSKAGKR